MFASWFECLLLPIPIPSWKKRALPRLVRGTRGCIHPSSSPFVCCYADVSMGGRVAE